MTGLRRSLRLLRAFRHEQSDPISTYAELGRDAATQLRRYTPLRGRSVLDIGGGPGYTAEALRAEGAVAFTADPSLDELGLHGRTPRHAVVADGTCLPLADGGVDVCCSFNTLEHVEEPWAFLDELVRVTRPGGVLFVGVTNWLSPWGGHETSPWHYLGGGRAADRYERRTGTAPKNRFGHSLFKVHVRDVLAWARSNENVELREAFPRYYPDWCRWLVQVPGVREVATWNLGLILDRR